MATSSTREISVGILGGVIRTSERHTQWLLPRQPVFESIFSERRLQLVRVGACGKITAALVRPLKNLSFALCLPARRSNTYGRPRSATFASHCRRCRSIPRGKSQVGMPGCVVRLRPSSGATSFGDLDQYPADGEACVRDEQRRRRYDHASSGGRTQPRRQRALRHHARGEYRPPTLERSSREIFAISGYRDCTWRAVGA